MRKPPGLGRAVVTLAVFCAFAFGWLAWLLFHAHALPGIGQGAGYKMSVVFPTTASLSPGSRVTVAGVDVGSVQSIQRAGSQARVRLQITDKTALPFPTDTTARLRQHTPVGENYVELSKGKAQTTMPSGSTIAATQTDEYVDVDQILSTLKGDTRERARQSIQSLGGALAGHGDQLNQTVGQGAGILNNGQHLVAVADRDRTQAAQLIDQLGDLAAQVGQRGDAIHSIADTALTGFGAIRDRDAALSATLDKLPDTLVHVRNVVNSIGHASTVVTPVVDNLTAASREVRPAVRSLGPAAIEGQAVLHQLSPAAPKLEDTLKSVTALSKTLPTALPKIHDVICQGEPILRYSKPYFPTALFILEGLGSSSDSYDATGHLIRLAPVVGPNSASGEPDNVEKASDDLFHAGLLSKSSSMSYDAYPTPQDFGTEMAHGDFPEGPQDIPKTGYKYPHVTADC